MPDHPHKKRKKAGKKKKRVLSDFWKGFLPSRTQRLNDVIKDI